MDFLLRYRYWIGGLCLVLLTATVLVQTVPFAGMAWASLTGRPDLGLVRDIRGTLLQQDRFQEMLADHEQEALRRFRRHGTQSYQRRRLYRTPLRPFGVPVGYDIWAIRVRTDVVEGKARTSFLARPGLVITSNSAAFFSRQCKADWCKAAIRALYGATTWLVEKNILTTYYLNVTESDVTSSATTRAEPVSTEAWTRQSAAMHRRGKGRSFADLPK